MLGLRWALVLYASSSGSQQQEDVMPSRTLRDPFNLLMAWKEGSRHSLRQKCLLSTVFSVLIDELFSPQGAG